MRRFDCGELFERSARGISGSCGWIEYRWRIPPRIPGDRDPGARRVAGRTAPEFTRGATLLTLGAFLAVAGVVYAAAQAI